MLQVAASAAPTNPGPRVGYGVPSPTLVWPGGVNVPVGGDDVLITRTGARWALRAYFSALRAHGLEPVGPRDAEDAELIRAYRRRLDVRMQGGPNAGGPTLVVRSRTAEIERVLIPLRTVVGRPRIGGLGTRLHPLSVGFASASAEEEEDAPELLPVPDPRIGVADGADYIPELGRYAEVVAEYGPYQDSVADLAVWGIGKARRVNGYDAWYGAVFPRTMAASNFYEDGGMVPTPAEIRSQAAARGYTRFSRVLEMLEACLADGVIVDLTVWNAGGGAQNNETLLPSGRLGSDVSSTSIGPAVGGSVHTWAEVISRAPSWQKGFITPSTEGWDPWYWDPAQVIPDSADTIPTEEQLYQAVVQNLWPAELGADGSTLNTRYQAGCTMRKSLAVAAYASVFADFLVSVEQAWVDTGMATSIEAALGVVELSNELDAFFTLPTGSVSAKDLQDGVSEVGRYLALMAGPIRASFPTLPMRVELMTSHGSEDAPAVDPSVARMMWLRQVLAEGIPAETLRWRTLRTEWSAPSSPDLAAWLSLLADSEVAGTDGWSWPRSPAETTEEITPGSLVQQVGFHWFRGNDYVERDRNPWRYADEVRLLRELTWLRSNVTAAAAVTRRGYRLRPTVGAIGFAAIDPVTYGAAPTFAERYQSTSPLFQAGMLFRLLGTAIAGGAVQANWFTHQAGVMSYGKSGFAGWAYIFATGIRNEIHAEGTSFTQGADNWARPSAYAARRLSWLLGRCAPTGPRVAYAQEGLVVLEFPFRVPLSVRPEGLVKLLRPWSRAYVCWLDQYCDSEDNHRWDGSAVRGSASAVLRFRRPGSPLGTPIRDEIDWDATWPPAPIHIPPPTLEAHQLLPLAPDVTVDGTVDALGYAGAARDWTWPGWAGTARIVAFSDWLYLTLPKIDPSTNILPICLLTDCELESVT